MLWLIWVAPIVAAIAVAAAPKPPGAWLDSLFHFFGIGGIDSRRGAIAALVIVAVMGFGTDAVLTTATTLATPWRQLDSFAVGLAAAFSALLLAGWLNPHAASSGSHPPDQAPQSE